MQRTLVPSPRGASAPQAVPLLSRIKSRVKRLLKGGQAQQPVLRYDVDTYRTLRAVRRWQETDVIVDVGANDGRTILRWREHLPKTRVYAFEPVSSTFQTLAAATRGLDDVTLFQKALGARQEQRDIHLDPQSAMNSFYAGRVSGTGTETVEIDTLDAVCADLDIRRIHLLKIDAEGHDLEVLKGARRLLDEGRIEVIQVEAGFGAPGSEMPSLAEFQTLLAPAGYYLHKVTNQCFGAYSRYNPGDWQPGDPNPSILVYCDAIFVSGRPAPAE